MSQASHAWVLNIFYYSELSHFSYNAQSFFIATVPIYSLVLQCSLIFMIAAMISHFLIAIMLSHSTLRQCSVIPHCYSAQSFFTAPVLSHSSRYSTQSLIVAKMLSHFPLQMVLNHSSVLQCPAIPHLLQRLVIPRCYSAWGCLVILQNDGAHRLNWASAWSRAH
jgi:hypothetical protein